MATIYYRTALTGGGATALDEEDGANLVDGDVAIVLYNGDLYVYLMDADGGAVESSPTVIVPDTNPGTINWVLQNVYSVTSGVNPPTGVSITGGIAGMVLSNDTDTAHDINITAGACMDSTGSKHILAASEMTKQIDAVWAAGNDAGGLLNGSVAANELYHIYALRKDADGTADYGFLDKDDAIGTYLPAGYSHYRWIGYVLTDESANIRGFVHVLKDTIIFNSAFEILTSVSGSIPTSKDLSGVIPSNKTEAILVGAIDPAGSIFPEIRFGITTEQSVSGQITSGPTWWEMLHTPGSAVWANVTINAALFVAIGIDINPVNIWMKAVKIIR